MNDVTHTEHDADAAAKAKELLGSTDDPTRVKTVTSTPNGRVGFVVEDPDADPFTTPTLPLVEQQLAATEEEQPKKRSGSSKPRNPKKADAAS